MIKASNKDRMVKKALEHLSQEMFISIATSDGKGNPSVSTKVLLQAKGNTVYVVDHVYGRTCKNLKINPKVCLSSIDMEEQVGYQLYGFAELVKDKQKYNKLVQEVKGRQIHFATARVIKGVRRERSHGKFEVLQMQNFYFFKVNIKAISRVDFMGERHKKEL
ncbi:MAG: pyridoxamine 5'-phosphate oxidase family protein [Candidatus Omnitrophica bacterium]|nr:pyridoxamine 5'-phosphate oxidase family protein [Candidatus Omnitrophota bacterium]